MSPGYQPLRALDLFSGAGGLALGVELAGISLLAVVDIDPICCRTLELNRPEWPVICVDVRRLDLGQFRERPHLLTGGPPCQPFSAASIRHGRGALDGRDCIPYFMRALIQLEPEGFILENVPGLLEPRNHSYFHRMVGRLRRGYRVAWKVLDASGFEVPQRRRRLILMGIRRDLGITPTFPAESPGRLSLRSVLRQDHLDGRWLRYPGGRSATEYNGASRLKIIPWTPPSRPGRKAVIRKGQDPDQPTDTLKATQSKMGDRALCVCGRAPNGNIYVQPLGVKACAALQGFPAEWKFSGTKTKILAQIGNAVPPPFAAALAGHFRTLLESSQDLASDH